LWEALKALFQTTAANVAFVCLTILIIFATLIWEAETSRKDISVWGIDIKVHESDEVEACRAIQSSAHDQIAAVEKDRDDAYKVIESDQNHLQEANKLLLEARKRDWEASKEQDTRVSENDQSVSGRITYLVNDSAYRDKVIEWTRDRIAEINENVNQQCGAILVACIGNKIAN
jgi:hypothetical protein